MALVTCAGADVLRAHLEIPQQGAWTAEVVLDTDRDVTGSVTLAAAGGLSLAGVVARGGVNPALLRWEGVLVGGAGGLSKPVRGAFRNATAGDVLSAICSQSGEALSATVGAAVRAQSLPQWTLGQSTAAQALDRLAAHLGAVWRVLSDGTIWIGAETWPAASLPAGAEVVDPSQLVAYVEIGVTTPALLPGVALDGVGNVYGVEHWIEPSSVRTWAWTAPADVGARLRALVAQAQQPALDRTALYRARVDAAASDGSTVDVTPLDPRISPAQAVPLRQPMPGAVVIPLPGAICRVGWDEADDGRLVAVPTWESGGASKAVLPADLVVLGAEPGAQFVALANLVKAELDKIAAAFSSFTPGTGGAHFSAPYTTASAVAATKVKAK